MKFDGAVPPNIGIAKKRFHEIRKLALIDMGEYWHANFRDKHFTEAGAKEYGYAERKASYKARKMRNTRQRRPLVWSGELERKVKGLASHTYKVVSRGSKYSLYIILRGTQKANYRRDNRRDRLRFERRRNAIAYEVLDPRIDLVARRATFDFRLAGQVLIFDRQDHRPDRGSITFKK